MESSDEWSIPCLKDDEVLEPSPEELDAMYQKLNSDGMIELFWKCPGRRPPTPVQAANAEIKKNPNATQSTKNLEFDFSDDVSAPSMRVQRPTARPKTTVKKKTANFANILDTVNKNKRTFQK